MFHIAFKSTLFSDVSGILKEVFCDVHGHLSSPHLTERLPYLRLCLSESLMNYIPLNKLGDADFLLE